MAYDQDLAHRVRAVLSDLEIDPVERQMFGGLAFMVRGHMTAGIIGDELMVRVGRDAQEDALARPHAREMDFTGKPMAGMVYVAPEGIASERDLRGWVQRGLDFTATLPAK